MFKPLLFAAAALAALCSFADSFDGRLSEVGKLQYETALPYEQILKKDVTDESFNPKIRFKAVLTAFSSKPPPSPYSQLLTKSANCSLIFKGSQESLPLFVNDSKKSLMKTIEKIAPGEKVFVYATLNYSWMPKKDKDGSKNVLVAYLLLDDLLLPDEELAMDAYRAKFGKARQAKGGAPAKPKEPGVKAKDLLASND